MALLLQERDGNLKDAHARSEAGQRDQQEEKQSHYPAERHGIEDLRKCDEDKARTFTRSHTE